MQHLGQHTSQAPEAIVVAMASVANKKEGWLNGISKGNKLLFVHQLDIACKQSMDPELTGA